jgi:hypothetical protein
MKKILAFLKKHVLPEEAHYTFPDGVYISTRHAWVSRVPFREGYDAADGGGSNPYPSKSIQARSWNVGYREGERAAMVVL